jgi:hypothetical protein
MPCALLTEVPPIDSDEADWRATIKVATKKSRKG